MRRRPALLIAALLGSCAKPPPPTCDDTESFACFTGVFSGLLGARLEGVEVCTPDLPDIPCVQSDSDGGWKLPGLPLDTDVAVTATYEDAIPTLFPQHTSMDGYAWYKVMVPESIVDTHASRLDTALNPDRGHLLFLVWEGLNIDGKNTPNVPDVTATLTPDDAEIFYANSIGLAAKGATETTGSGSGGALNLPEALYEVQFEAPGGKCKEHAFSFAFTGDGPIPVPIRPGFATAIDVICPAP